MNETREDTSPAPGSTRDEPSLVWAAAAAVAGFGYWMLYDALPGLNWLLWTFAAVAGLSLFTLRRGQPPRSVLLLGAVPVVIAGAAAVTASPVITVLICLAIMILLAMQMLLATSTSLRSITTIFAALAPPVALRHAVIHSARRAIEATNLIRSTRARAWVRGLAITLPVLIGFALLLAEADPVFAGWRDAIGAFIANWEFVPRMIFFVALLVVVLGAYGHASVGQGSSPAMEAKAPDRWLGSTERLMLLASVAALFWLFLAMQLGYLFGNLPRIAESGVTFAEYARRGFGELTIVASASALLIVASERLPALPDSVRSELRRAVREQIARRKERQRTWYEWNLASSRARRALDASFASP